MLWVLGTYVSSTIHANKWPAVLRWWRRHRFRPFINVQQRGAHKIEGWSHDTSHLRWNNFFMKHQASHFWSVDSPLLELEQLEVLALSEVHSNLEVHLNCTQGSQCQLVYGMRPLNPTKRSSELPTVNQQLFVSKQILPVAPLKLQQKLPSCYETRLGSL